MKSQMKMRLTTFQSYVHTKVEGTDYVHGLMAFSDVDIIDWHSSTAIVTSCVILTPEGW